MPELPEVETTLRGVAPHLVGRQIVDLIVRESRLRWPIPPEVIQLRGDCVTAARRRGKYLLFETGAGTLIVHLGMSGSLRVTRATDPWRKHDHVAWTLDSGVQLRLHDPRRFGAVLLTTTPERHPLLVELGPEPLGDEFTAAYLHDVTRTRAAPIKSIIMDSHTVVGVGNIYACEALFRAGIRPTRRASRLSKADCSELAAAIRSVLQAAIDMGGTTLRDFVHGQNEPGYFKQSLQVYDRAGEPCRLCASPIRRTLLGQRSTYLCPRCQRR